MNTKKQRSTYLSNLCWERLTYLAERAHTDRSNFIELLTEQTILDSLFAEQRKNEKGVPNETVIKKLQELAGGN